MMNFIDEAGGFVLEVLKFFFLMFIVLVIIGGIGLGIYGIYQFTKSPEQVAADKKQEAYESTPHVYSQVDGCTVYIWRNGGYNHYFTKCDNTNKVVTQSAHGESCGKACTRTITEKIETK